MANCKNCYHERACAAWIRHGETLYDDFEYSVEECPYYEPIVHSAWKYGNCMKCGLYVGETTSTFFKYCPNCGAHMDGGKE